MAEALASGERSLRFTPGNGRSAPTPGLPDDGRASFALTRLRVGRLRAARLLTIQPRGDDLTASRRGAYAVWKHTCPRQPHGSRTPRAPNAPHAGAVPLFSAAAAPILNREPAGRAQAFALAAFRCSRSRAMPSHPRNEKQAPSRETPEAQKPGTRSLERWDDEGGAGRQGARKESEHAPPRKPRAPKH